MDITAEAAIMAVTTADTEVFTEGLGASTVKEGASTAETSVEAASTEAAEAVAKASSLRHFGRQHNPEPLP